jgi:tetratricopeptide (TPR) repeat protein
VAYTLVLPGTEPRIDLEFDRLYSQLFDQRGERVRQRCLELLSSLEGCLWPHLLLGYVELNDKKFEVAHEHFSKAVLLPEPLGLEARAGVGRALARLSRHAEALHLLQELVKSDSENHFVWHALGEVLIGLGDCKSAWMCAQQAAQLCPTHTGAVSLLVAAGAALSRHRELIELLVAVQEEQPWNLDVRGAAALSLLRDNRPMEAAQEMSRVVSFAPFTRVSPAILQAIHQGIASLGAIGA